MHKTCVLTPADFYHTMPHLARLGVVYSVGQAACTLALGLVRCTSKRCSCFSNLHVIKYAIVVYRMQLSWPRTASQASSRVSTRVETCVRPTCSPLMVLWATHTQTHTHAHTRARTQRGCVCVWGGGVHTRAQRTVRSTNLLVWRCAGGSYMNDRDARHTRARRIRRRVYLRPPLPKQC